MASSDLAPFSDREIALQSIGNATSLPYLLAAYGLDCGWSAERTALFCGGLFAKGWERMRGADALAMARQIALNLVCCGGEVRSLTGGALSAEARVTGLPDPFELDLFGIAGEDALQFCSIFIPSMRYLDFDFSWNLDGDEIVLRVGPTGDRADRIEHGGPKIDVDSASYSDDEIYQQALSNASSLPYLMVALARSCGRTPEDAAAFAAARFAPIWEALRDEGAAAVAREMTINAISCGGELVRFAGDQHHAEVSVAGVPTDAEAAFFAVALDDVDKFYGSLCLTAEHLGYLASWRREGNEILLTVQSPKATT